MDIRTVKSWRREIGSNLGHQRSAINASRLASIIGSRGHFWKISRFHATQPIQLISTGSSTTTLFYRPMMLSNFAANVPTPQFVLVSSAGILLVYGICKISTFIYHEMTSPVRDVPGPPSSSFIYGNFKQISESVG